MKLSRLRGRKVNEYLRKEGRVWRGKTMTIRWLPQAPRHPNIHPDTPALYTGTAGSTKLHKSAVKRNRMRRRCREALRKTMRGIDQLPPTQILISPRIRSLTCDFDDIVSDVEQFVGMIVQK